MTTGLLKGSSSELELSRKQPDSSPSSATRPAASSRMALLSGPACSVRWKTKGS